MVILQGDQKVSAHLTITVNKNPHSIDDMKMAITEYIRNVDRAVLNTVFENTFRHVNKCLETGGGHLNITCNFLDCNHQVHRDFLITLHYVELTCCTNIVQRLDSTFTYCYGLC